MSPTKSHIAKLSLDLNEDVRKEKIIQEKEGHKGVTMEGLISELVQLGIDMKHAMRSREPYREAEKIMVKLKESAGNGGEKG